MKEYVIVVDAWESNGGSFKYASNPKKRKVKFEYAREEREDFIKKVVYCKKEDMYYENVRLFYINYDDVTISEITDEQFKNMKEGI
mgnify:CR=1 FL=1